MAYVLLARGPEAQDLDGNPLGTTPVIATIDGSRPYRINNTILVATADAGIPAALEVVAPPASKQRTRWMDKANTGDQATPIPPATWQRAQLAETELGTPLLRAVVAEAWAELDVLRVAASLPVRTNGARIAAVRSRLNTLVGGS